MGDPVLGEAANVEEVRQVEDPDIRWRFACGPYFDNQLATLSLDGREAMLTLSKTVYDPDREGVGLETAFERRIA